MDETRSLYTTTTVSASGSTSTVYVVTKAMRLSTTAPTTTCGVRVVLQTPQESKVDQRVERRMVMRTSVNHIEARAHLETKRIKEQTKDKTTCSVRAITSATQTRSSTWLSSRSTSRQEAHPAPQAFLPELLAKLAPQLVNPWIPDLQELFLCSSLAVVTVQSSSGGEATSNEVLTSDN